MEGLKLFFNIIKFLFIRAIYMSKETNYPTLFEFYIRE